MARGLASLLAVLLLMVVAAGCGGDDDDASSGSRDIPPGAVATVGDAEISEQDLDEQVALLSRAERGGSGGSDAGARSPAAGDDSTAADDRAAQERERLEAQALSLLLVRQALEQEAADRGIEVSDAEVRGRWEAVSQVQFKTKKALRRFLGGQTERDLLAQLRLQFLTERIHEQVSEQAGGGKQGAKAVEQFRKDFQKRRQDRTACRDGYTAAGCAGS